MKLLPYSVSSAIGLKILEVKKQSPHIFFAGGVVGVLGGTFLACKATLKLEKTLDIIKEDVNAVKELGEGSRKKGTNYSEKEYYQDLGYVYGLGITRLGRLYGPAVAVGAVSIAALTGSHVQLTRRNTALTITLAAVSKAYEEYRMRVQEEVGKGREFDIYRDMQEIEVQEDGKKKYVQIDGPKGYSPYARLFDEASTSWVNHGETNHMFVRCQQEYANHLLRAKGHIFLNEVYDQLGIERTPEGQVVGWVKNGDGDDYVDFGLGNPNAANFVAGYEKSVMLDFNVDGIVYDKI